jgi:hypothetical protein
MAFAKGKAFVILNRMAEKNQEASKLLNDLKQLEQGDFESRFGALLKSNPEFSEQSEPKETKLNLNEPVETATAKEQIKAGAKFKKRQISKSFKEGKSETWDEIATTDFGKQDPKMNYLIDSTLGNPLKYGVNKVEINNSVTNLGSFGSRRDKNDKLTIYLETPNIPGENAMYTKVHEWGHAIDEIYSVVSRTVAKEKLKNAEPGQEFSISTISNRLYETINDKAYEDEEFKKYTTRLTSTIDEKNNRIYNIPEFEMPQEAIDYISDLSVNKGYKAKKKELGEVYRRESDELQKTWDDYQNKITQLRVDSDYLIRQAEVYRIENNLGMDDPKFKEMLKQGIEKQLEVESIKNTEKEFYDEFFNKRDMVQTKLSEGFYSVIQPFEKSISDIYSTLVRNDKLSEQIGMSDVGWHSEEYYKGNSDRIYKELWANYFVLKASPNPEYLDKLRKWEPKLVETLDNLYNEVISDFELYDKILEKQKKDKDFAKGIIRK